MQRAKVRKEKNLLAVTQENVELEDEVTFDPL
jgi:hypothetical protein